MPACPSPASGWANTDVTVSLSATDPGAVASGVNDIVFSASGAQAIDETTVPGASADYPTEDMDGDARPNGTSRDAGADER